MNVLKYGTWANLGGISNGVNYANDLWVDKNQSLYVANDNGGVTEYNSAGDLIFTYSNGGRTIRGVTTDASGNVYTSGNNGATEFTQLSNTPIKMCNPGNEAGGVAVDTHGNVFVTMEFASRIMEYPRGLKASHCNGTVLPVAPTQVMGLAIDKQNDLVLCQGPNYPPDIIAPPYTSVTKTLGTGNCWNVTIDSTGTRAYLADYFAETINVLTYPGGSKVASICCFGDATAAVDSRNYVP